MLTDRHKEPARRARRFYWTGSLVAVKRPKWLRLGRKEILFFSGLAGVFHETFASRGERTTLLLLFAAMVGFPVFVHVDKSRSAKRNVQDDDE